MKASAVILLAAASAVSAQNCPDAWTAISARLTSMFLQGQGGQCNDDARAAIRAAFHDSGTWNKAQGDHGGADGSLCLAQEYLLPQSQPLGDICNKLQTLARQHQVGVADMLQFAGSHAIVTCPGGPTVKTYVGRVDNATAGPVTLLPGEQASASALISLWADKGFSVAQLTALLGAHSTSKQFLVDPSKSGAPQDSTPGIWDVKYYSETLNPVAGDFRFQSDINLANDAVSGPSFKSFVNNQGKWNSAFASAMAQLELLGVPGTQGGTNPSGNKQLIDCTGALPRPQSIQKVKRQLNPWMPRN